jgi:hypothetical protein
MPNIKAIRQKIQKNFFIKLTSVSKPWGGVPLGGPGGEDKLVTSWVHLYQWGGQRSYMVGKPINFTILIIQLHLQWASLTGTTDNRINRIKRSI